MSSRRGSAAATAESSLHASRVASPSHAGDDVDVSMGSGNRTVEADESAISANDARGNEGTYADDVRSGSGSRSGSLLGGSYIQRIPQLDIAFLHAVSSHRPLGPHKHFNLIPILVTLDRVVRQVGAQARDSSRSRELENDEGDADDEGRSEIKREDEEKELGDETRFESSLALQVSNVDAEMVWQRLEELYDVEGLEELEDQAVDADDESPFHKQPEPSFVSKMSRKTLGNSVDVPASFGFGSTLARISEANALGGSTTKSVKAEKQKKTAKAKAAAQEDNDEDDDERILDFELGPWEEYEVLIAPRRLKSAAPDEEGHSDSDGELSGYSGTEGNEKAKSTAVKEEENDDTMEETGGEDDADEEAHEDEEEEDVEEEEEDEEEEQQQPSAKRKASSLSKKTPPLSRQKRSTAAGSSTPTPNSAAPVRSSRSSSAVKPRRSGRR